MVPDALAKECYKSQSKFGSVLIFILPKTIDNAVFVKFNLFNCEKLLQF